MIRFFIIAACFILWANSASAGCTAPCTQNQLLTEINTNWADNTTNNITPALLRAPVSDIVNTYFALLSQYQIPVNTIAIGKGVGVNGLNSATVTAPLILSGSTLSCPTCIGSGTVTSASVVTANGFSGSVATATTTPAITLSTTVTGITKGNGTALSAAVAGTDYQSPISLTTTGTSGASTFIGNTLNIPQYSTIPGGSNTQVQYNNAGSFGGITGATTNGTALTLVAPVLGTPASATLTNATGLPISTGLTGAGTGVITALGVNVGTAGSVVVNGGALGTPSSGVATNLTGTASGLTAGNVTTNANLTGAVTSVGNASSLGSFTSANLRGAITDESGTGLAYFQGGDIGTPSAGVATNLSGTAASLTSGNATKLATARAIGIAGSTGLTATGVNFDGTAAINPALTGTLIVANGGTGDTGTAWSTYTASPTCTSGTWTTGTARFKTLGKTVFWQLTVTNTVACSPTTDFTFTLPATAQSGASAGTIDLDATGSPLLCRVPASSATMNCRTFSGGTLTSAQFRLSGVYESQ